MLRAQHGAAGPAPSIQHQARGAQIMQISNIYSKKERSTFQRQGVYPRSAGWDSANSMQKIACSSLAYIFFERIHDGLRRTVPVYTSSDNVLNLFMQVHTSMYRFVLVCTCTDQFMTSMYLSIPVYTGIYQDWHVHIWLNLVKFIEWDKRVHPMYVL